MNPRILTETQQKAYKDIEQASTRCIHFLSDVTSYSGAKSKAVVFDIDDTLIHSRTKQPIIPVLGVYNHCKSLGFTPFIITARSESPLVRHITETQLEECGITGYGELLLQPPSIQCTATYKMEARKRVYNMHGLTTVLSVGDEQWDIGDYGGMGVVIPKIR